MNELSLNRDALIIYLNNLCIVETIIHQSERRKKALLDELQSKQNEVQSAKDTLNSYENGSPQFVKARTVYDPGFFDNFVEWGGCYWLFIVIMLAGLATILPIVGGIVALIVGIGFFIYFSDKRSKEKQNDQYQRDAQQQNTRIQQQWNSGFSNAREKCTQLQAEYNRKAPMIRDEVSKLDRVISRMSRIRENMYNMDIIPATHNNPSTNLRTLPGVQYLHEFMSTSRESFTTAIYSYKLDLIISRLDALIANTERMIQNQYDIIDRQDRQLRGIMQQEQNQRRMMQNQNRMNEAMENIRDYNAMIAQNSEVQTALAQEALYYQRVRYWKDL